MFVTIEKRGRAHTLKIYELVLSNGKTETKIELRREKMLDGNFDAIKIDMDETYIAVTQNRGEGLLTVYRISDLEKIYQIEGNNRNQRLGKDGIRVFQTKLEPMGDEAHHIYYGTVQPDSLYINKFSVGMISIIHYNETTGGLNEAKVVKPKHKVFNNDRVF
jgi:hypothetical protein